MKRSISNNIKKGKARTQLSSEMREFLGDFHNFTNKWPTQKIAKLPEINTTRQNIYMGAKNRREKKV